MAALHPVSFVFLHRSLSSSTAALQQTWTPSSSLISPDLFNAYQIEEKKLFDSLLDREGEVTGTKHKVVNAVAPHLTDPLRYAAAGPHVAA